jgi:hypothetical protein
MIKHTLISTSPMTYRAQLDPIFIRLIWSNNIVLSHINLFTYFIMKASVYLQQNNFDAATIRRTGIIKTRRLIYI